MSNRVPAALNWLVNKRARIQGEILRAEDELKNKLEEIEVLSSTIQKVRIDLAAIDRTLGMHEVKIDPNNISPIRSHVEERKIKHGEITRKIFICLRQENGNEIFTSQIAISVGLALDQEYEDEKQFQVFKDVVRKRLKTLCSEGRVKRIRRSRGTSENSWSLGDLIPEL